MFGIIDRFFFLRLDKFNVLNGRFIFWIVICLFLLNFCRYDGSFFDFIVSWLMNLLIRLCVVFLYLLEWLCFESYFRVFLGWGWLIVLVIVFLDKNFFDSIVFLNIKVGLLFVFSLVVFKNLSCFWFLFSYFFVYIGSFFLFSK